MIGGAIMGKYIVVGNFKRARKIWPLNESQLSLLMMKIKTEKES